MDSAKHDGNITVEWLGLSWLPMRVYLVNCRRGPPPFLPVGWMKVFLKILALLKRFSFWYPAPLPEFRPLRGASRVLLACTSGKLGLREIMLEDSLHGTWICIVIEHNSTQVELHTRHMESNDGWPNCTIMHNQGWTILGALNAWIVKSEQLKHGCLISMQPEASVLFIFVVLLLRMGGLLAGYTALHSFCAICLRTEVTVSSEYPKLNFLSIRGQWIRNCNPCIFSQVGGDYVFKEKHQGYDKSTERWAVTGESNAICSRLTPRSAKWP